MIPRTSSSTSKVSADIESTLSDLQEVKQLVLWEITAQALF